MSKTGVTINTKMWEQIKARLPDDIHVKVGVMAAAGGEKTHKGSDITVLELAAIHEFGSPAAGIPERSFIRSTFNRAEVRTGLARMGGALARSILSGRSSPEEAFGRLGAWAVAQIRQTIVERDTTGPQSQALKPATIRAKGSSTPLIDTSQLLRAISWLVTAGGVVTGKKRRARAAKAAT